MTGDPHEHGIIANPERAEASLKAGTLLAGEGYYDFAASRAYYAAFYASTAALLSEGMTFSEHEGVVSAFHERFVKTGRLGRQFGRDLNWLFALRTVGDYGQVRHVEADDAGKAIDLARAFVGAVKEIIEKT